MTRAMIAVGCFLALTTFAGAQTQQDTRIDLYNQKSEREGYLIYRNGRIDQFDSRGNRQGYGTIDQNGRVDLFDRRGNRQGYGTITPNGTLSSPGR
jgi:hypothetical protein